MSINDVDPVPGPTMREPRHRPSPRAKRFWMVNALAGWLVVLAAQVVWAAIAGGWDNPWRIAGAAATLVIGGIQVLVAPGWRYRIHRWEIDDVSVYARSGWFTQEDRVAPIARIQTVDLHQGAIARRFGLADVVVTTASAAGPVKIHALDRDVAMAAVARLTSLVEQTRGDAT